MTKKISKSTMLNIVLVAVLAVVIVFGYFYLRGVSPDEVISSKFQVDVPEYEFMYPIYPGQKGFDSPHEVLAFNNSVYVSDFRNARIAVFSRKGDFLKDIKHKELVNPAGMFWDGEKLWVADPGSNKVLVMNPEGAVIDKIEFEEKILIADIAAQDNFIFILNNRDMRVEKYDINSKKKVKNFGGFGKDDGQLYYPYSIEVRDGKVFVADSQNNRINIYNLEGKFIEAWPKRVDGEKGGGLSVPRGLAFDQSGRLYTVQGLGHRVTAMNSNGEIELEVTKGEKINDEPIDINLPTDVAIDEVGRMYVLEDAFKRILVYKVK